MKRNSLLFIIISMGIVLIFLLDLRLGSVAIPMDAIVDLLQGEPIKQSWEYILINFRLPKAITACIVGAGVSITGLQMQTLFRNPLADTSILGVGHGASLGVATFVLAPNILPGLLSTSISNNYWGLIIASIMGAFVVLAIVSSIATWMRDIVSLLIIGVMLGFITGSLVSILQFFSDPETVQSFLIWTFGSLSGTTWTQLQFLIPIVSIGLFASLLLPKSMNAILLGENYAKSVGVSVKTIRITLVVLTGLITGTLTAFVGPIAFLGIAVPHVARLLFKTANHRTLIPATMLLGVLLMLCCDIISQLPGSNTTIPINSVTSILGAPIVIFVIMQNRRKKSIF
ncbi:iron complex transport system permease protein [Balneicella halophila]|uniref:Iron complex transport system permease protein n=1 Tax=Balneicella halophila TaxID=1537566 RepID=A0A7L4UQI5_BALHA|nr:iron ABC transporter permease [Balneicella halophila]PVX50000.1 iron complex transport system permease protein [Balneicella halophila]